MGVSKREGGLRDQQCNEQEMRMSSEDLHPSAHANITIYCIITLVGPVYAAFRELVLWAWQATLPPTAAAQY